MGQFAIVEETKPILFADYAEEWLTTSVEVRCKPSTVEEYGVVYQMHLKPVFGAKALRDITRGDVRQFLAGKLEQGLSRARVQGLLAVLRSLLSTAAEDGHVPANPAARMGRLFNKQQRKEIRPLTKEELALFLRTAREYDPAHYPFFLLLARTGMRLGEALALKWEDIDFHGCFIEVRRSRRRGRLSTPKSNKGRRVDTSRQLRETLHVLLETRKEEAWRKGWEQVPEWVFCDEKGTMLNETTIRCSVFHSLLHRAGLRRIRLHDLRHTYASLLIQQGESLVYIKEQLGHHSIKITVDTYGHLVPGGNRQAVDRLDEDPQSPVPSNHPQPIRNLSQDHDAALSEHA